jgi:hypothetical protein
MKNLINGLIVVVITLIVIALLDSFFASLSKKNNDYIIKKYGVPTCSQSQEPECIGWAEETKEGETATVTVKYCIQYSCLPIY